MEWSGNETRPNCSKEGSFQAHASEGSILENIVYQASIKPISFLPLKGVGNGPSLVPTPSPSFPSLAAKLQTMESWARACEQGYNGPALAG